MIHILYRYRDIKIFEFNLMYFTHSQNNEKIKIKSLYLVLNVDKK